MFIDFAGMMININYIISIYKTTYETIAHNTFFEVNIRLYPANTVIKEGYHTRKEQETRFAELVAEINE